MIKLTLNPGASREIKIFDKKIIVIGSDEAAADLFLPHANLEPCHLKIEQIGKDYYIQNMANDPFATLNSVSFGRKKLADNDLIQIGALHIQFNLESVPEQIPNKNVQFTYEREAWLDTGEGQLQQLVEKKIISNAQNVTLNVPPPSSHSLEEIGFEEETEWEEKELLDLLSKEERAEIGEENTRNGNSLEGNQTTSFEPVSAPPAAREETPSELLEPQKEITTVKKEPLEVNHSPNNHKKSLKDYYLSDFDDESEVWNQHKKNIQNPIKLPIKWNWKAFGVIVTAIFLVLAFLMAVVFFYLRAKNHEEELDAAEAVADISMALAFAQLNHIKPLNQNWSDPDFLKNNLMAVLASEYAPASFFENHGQFKNNDYSLRIYSSTDLSQFLVIAQPVPSIIQWLVPKASILVDSSSMEMHRTTDLKSLNRLLQHPNPLDGMNAAEVSSLIKNEDIITFTSLSVGKKDLGYVFAKALAYLQPGAENRIYNAPRYYPFSETFLKKALHITDDSVNQYERSLVQEEFQHLSKFPGLVLYSSKGIKWIQRAQKAMGFLYPNNNFLFASLILDKSGTVLDSHLILGAKGSRKEAEQDVEEFAWAVEQGDKLNSLELEFNESENDDGESSSVSEDIRQDVGPEVDIDYPLYKALSALAIEQKKNRHAYELQLQNLLETEQVEALLPFLTKLQSLLHIAETRYENEPQKLEKNHAALNFFEALVSTIKHYQETKNSEQQHIAEKLFSLQKEYENIPYSEFIAYIKASGLKGLDLKEIKPPNYSEQKAELLEAKLQALFINIQNADNLASLDLDLTALSQILTLNNISDAKKLVEYQNEIRLNVLRKLNDFLLASDPTISSKDLVPENRPVLANILKTAHVVDPDEFDFYLNEFDLRLQNPSH